MRSAIHGSPSFNMGLRELEKGYQRHDGAASGVLGVTRISMEWGCYGKLLEAGMRDKVFMVMRGMKHDV